MLFDLLFWCLSWLDASLVVFLLEKHLFWTLDRSSIVARHLLDLSSLFCRWYLLHLSRFCSRHLLDTYSIYRDAYFYIYLRFDLVCSSLKYFDHFLFSLDPNTFYSQNPLYPSRFRPYPSLNPLASALSSSFSLSFMHLDLGFRFWENLLGFLCFC